MPYRLTVLIALLLAGFALAADEKPHVPTPGALTPAQSLAKMKVPEGFKVTLFAGEPDVVQPIAMTLDDRGRLWVVECLSYPTWKETGNDRIVIFEDKDNDGKFDSKKVFWDKGRYTTGIALGFGGVYIANAPDLAFIPDKDGDDKPDGPPEVLLDGWSTAGKHNVLNALKWGPDGWLYGCNGITAPSKVGKPKSEDKDRVEINCGVWRYHPVKHKFEVVAHGTTNPWGLDWDQYGQMFITNCVIKHIFHIILGGHYERMFGEDVNKFSYGLIQSPADHIHWAEGTKWTDSRGGKGAHDAAGGGHAHAGLMIYQGDNWPKEYRNNAFIPNVHGGRVNRDTIEAKGSGYTVKHNKDFLFAHDDWFRGLEMISGPDGGVYITDWHDTGECHDYDKAEITTGRIYKVTYADAKPLRDPFEMGDISRLTDYQLVDLHFNTNPWHVRNARRLLQERAATRKLDPKAIQWLVDLELVGKTPHNRNALWTMHAIGEFEMRARELWDHYLQKKAPVKGDANVYWLIQLDLEDGKPTDFDALVKMAKEVPSPLVRLALASGLQRLPLDQRWPIAEALSSREEDANDANIPLMIWYGIEPAVAADKDKALALAKSAKIPLLRQYIARRIAAANAPKKAALKFESKDDQIIITREGGPALVTQNAKPDFRPYLHPIMAPDGKGVLTEFSPGHHKHQTGLYVGILKTNDRDYFHNPGGGYFKRTSTGRVLANAPANVTGWTVTYDWMGKDDKPQLSETQTWSMTDHGSHYTLDLNWSATAAIDITFGKHEYGGLFLRMPWKQETGGKAISSEGRENGGAEGQRAKWVDTGMPIEGRDKDDWGRIAILDHKDNPGHPAIWRVDGQLGVGPAPSRAGDWTIKKGETAKLKYRLVVYTGVFDKALVEKAWSEWK